jgi:CRP/FNR family cyclic AMP-dependent transcriptional regulator
MAQDEITAPDIEIIFARLNDGRSELKYQAYQTVYNQGDPADSVFYIKTGRAKVTIHSSEGKEAVVAILGRGDFCGEKCVAGYKLRRTTVRTLTECILVRMAKTAIIRTLHDDNALFDLFISYLVKHTVRVEEDLVDQLLNSTEKRLARLLINLANCGKEDWPYPIVPRVSQETLAEMVGVTRGRVNFFMNKFRQLGFIEYNGDIKVQKGLLNVLLSKSRRLQRHRHLNDHSTSADL